MNTILMSPGNSKTSDLHKVLQFFWSNKLKKKW